LRKLRALLVIPDSEPVDYGFVASDVARFHRLQQAGGEPAGAALDDATWKDLMIDAYRAHLADKVSIFGQQLLYHRLRAGQARDARAAQAERLRSLIADPARLEQLQLACKSLRHADREIATLLYEDKAPSIPWWAGKTWPLPLLLIVSIVAVVWSPLAWLLSFAVLFVLMREQMRYHERVSDWQRSMGSLQALLKVVSLLGARKDEALQPFTQRAATAGRINRALSRSPFSAAVPQSRAYLDWFMLANVNHYFKGAALVHGELAFLRACFLLAGELEADLALARHLRQAPALCWAEPGGGKQAREQVHAIDLAQAVHPLLAGARPLDVRLDGKGAFISGQNGIGKSTLLRTVGLNLVTARAFGFCYAQHARLPDLWPLAIHASMQSEDSMAGGESLYMAELRRARELLVAAEGAPGGIYIIDEIFRGTNHLESVSAAAAVLDVLAARGLVIVSSHNLVLAPLLAHRLDPLCVRLDEAGRLVLAPGVLAHTNGIALLASRGFGPQVEANAGKVFDWLGGYLAHPADCSAVLS